MENALLSRLKQAAWLTGAGIWIYIALSILFPAQSKGQSAAPSFTTSANVLFSTDGSLEQTCFSAHYDAREGRCTIHWERHRYDAKVTRYKYDTIKLSGGPKQEAWLIVTDDYGILKVVRSEGAADRIRYWPEAEQVPYEMYVLPRGLDID